MHNLHFLRPRTLKACKGKSAKEVSGKKHIFASSSLPRLTSGSFIHFLSHNCDMARFTVLHMITKCQKNPILPLQILSLVCTGFVSPINFIFSSAHFVCRSSLEAWLSHWIWYCWCRITQYRWYLPEPDALGVYSLVSLVFTASFCRDRFLAEADPGLSPTVFGSCLVASSVMLISDVSLEVLGTSRFTAPLGRTFN